jgi:hypothetical protein
LATPTGENRRPAIRFRFGSLLEPEAARPVITWALSLV